MSSLGEGANRTQCARSVMFFSVHCYTSKRKAGFQWLAQAYRKAGWQVAFVTVGHSWLSHLKRSSGQLHSNQWFQSEDGVWCYVWKPLFHPVNLRLAILNELSKPLFRTYAHLPIRDIDVRVRGARQIVIESSAAVMLLERLRRLSPDAQFIYRVSDDVRTIGSHPVVEAEERRLASTFDLISVPSPLLANKFGEGANVKVLRHGTDPAMLSQSYPDPYPNDGRVRVLSIGQTLFDYETASAAARSFPEWSFHFFGDLSALPRASNIYNHGEVKFDELKPYLAHADIGAAFYHMKPGAEYLVDTSNKIAQYALAHLPIVCPLTAPPDRNDFFMYSMADLSSLRDAFLRAAKADRASLRSPRPSSWDDVANELMSI